MSDQQEEFGELLSVAQAAEYCGCSEDKILDWGHAGKIRLINIGDGKRALFRTPKADVLNLLHARVVQTVQEVRRERRTAYRPRYIPQRRNRGAYAPHN